MNHDGTGLPSKCKAESLPLGFRCSSHQQRPPTVPTNSAIETLLLPRSAAEFHRLTNLNARAADHATENATAPIGGKRFLQT